MNLAIDIGNTHTHMAVFNGSQMLREWQWEPGCLVQNLRGIQIERCAVACVGRYHDELRVELRQSGVEPLAVSGLTPTPLKMLYETPATLGADRLAAAVGAWTLKPGMPLLVIDCGTCITSDYVSAAGEYLGGNISPGEALRLEAMHDKTAQLPRCSIAGATVSVGRNTTQALQAGAHLGVAYEIRGYANDFLADNPEGHVFLTGGGLMRTGIKEEKRITIEKALVLKGLNAILNETNS